MPRFGDAFYTANQAATEAAYKAAAAGCSEECECAYCRNFRLARSQVFPASFVALLNELGIDPLKDAEVYQMTKVRPGHHLYGGWFHFVGTLPQAGQAPVDFDAGFQAWMVSGSLPRLDCFSDLPVVAVEFHAPNVPWLLAEDEP